MNIGAPSCLSEQSHREVLYRRTGVSLRVFLLCLACLACGAEKQEPQACYVCLDDTPYAFLCDRQVGLITKAQDDYLCNLYFGLTHQCQSLEFCCERVNAATNDGGQCVMDMPDAFMPDAFTPDAQ